ncbi:MAG: hypothetical protein C5S45_04220 [Candidatus Methanocomedens sp.]|nr:MAG: hypothetical protein C5S45_04220 [ANME-2 cluster archaeon]
MNHYYYYGRQCSEKHHLCFQNLEENMVKNINFPYWLKADTILIFLLLYFTDSAGVNG